MNSADKTEAKSGRKESYRPIIVLDIEMIALVSHSQLGFPDQRR